MKKQFLKFIRGLILIFSFAAKANDTLMLNDNTKYIDLRLHSFLLVDKNDSLAPGLFTHKFSNLDFKPFKDYKPNIYASGYWIKLNVKNTSSSINHWFIGFGNTNEEIRLYEWKSDGLLLMDITGIKYPVNEKQIISGKDDVLPVFLTPGTSKTYIINIKNKQAFGKNLFSHTMAYFKIYSNKYFLDKELMGRVLNAIFYGAVSIMFLYNLLIAFSLRTKDYVIYVSFSFLFIWFNFFSDGYAYETILAGLPNHDRWIRILVLPVMLSSYLLFARVYLKSALYTPKIDLIYYLFWTLLVFTYIPGVFFGLWSMTRSSMIIVTLFAMVFVFISSIACYNRGYKPAIYFILANTFLIISSILYSLNLADLLKIDFLVRTVEYQFQLSCVLEIGVFSLGLANRIKVAEKGKTEAQVRVIVALLENEVIIKDQNFRLEEKVKERTIKLAKTLKEVENEKVKSEQLLLNILPNVVANELKERGQATPQYFEQATILFADFVNFTHFAEQQTPHEVISKLNDLFLIFDEICEQNNLEKIKTIGDCYMAAGGLPISNTTNAKDCIKAAIEILNALKGTTDWAIRIGIHTGPIIAGVVGKHKFAYDIWGDAVNIASRAETASESNRINITKSTYELVKDEYKCTYRGKINTKNKGKMDMYFVEN
jgi:class 3 adenylate cyclase